MLAMARLGWEPGFQGGRSNYVFHEVSVPATTSTFCAGLLSSLRYADQHGGVCLCLCVWVGFTVSRPCVMYQVPPPNQLVPHFRRVRL